MVLGKRNKFFWLSQRLCLCSAILLFAVSVVNASPTITRHSTDLSVSLSRANTQTTTSGSINTVVKPVRPELANLAKEFLQPPQNSAGLLDDAVRHLPAVPATVLMLLAGFLCVSLYRDRKVWLTALAGLLWVSQAGIQTLPRLALRLSHRNHTKQQIRTELTYPYYLENSHRPRSDIEGTRYIGLLHHLAGIPNAKSTYTNNRVFTYSHKHTSTSQPAIFSEQYSLNLLFNCLAVKTKQFIYFSPAFIFETIPRGPPIPA